MYLMNILDSRRIKTFYHHSCRYQQVADFPQVTKRLKPMIFFTDARMRVWCPGGGVRGKNLAISKGDGHELRLAMKDAISAALGDRLNADCLKSAFIAAVRVVALI